MRLVAALLLLVALACGRTESVPGAVPGQVLVVHFLDKDAVLPLGKPSGGDWSFMNMGAWDRLEVRWRDGGRRGDAVVGQVAPDWLLLQDPEGDIHRVVLKGPPPEGIGEESGDWHHHHDWDDHEDEALAIWLAFAWLWSWHR